MLLREINDFVVNPVVFGRMGEFTEFTETKHSTMCNSQMS